ncbi:hypothetical protein L5515_018463 [Caenorhabditis briggsae]|uniref:Nuclear Hormone Receptor family n=1 Tax=Caenorhabditis briggsae TaxID=6238 RepID=A0AAE9CVN5_CAEBR|nr:hypothetical protein L3Y34_012607 [Caenorhabditis briggsae]UMM42761.1 hypothetical protein L5515_018463 [Caenorhabditis briggsae]
MIFELASMESQFCVICGQSTSLYNYGTISCSACSSFFRRTVLAKVPIQQCPHQDACYTPENRATHSECKYCRFHKCVDVGMINTQKYTNLTKLINQLSVLDKKRSYTCANMMLPPDFRLSSIFDYEHIKLIKKTPEVRFISHDWGCVHQLASMEFIKTFQFVKFLSLQDLQVFMKTAHFNHVIFASAMRSFGIRQGYLSFPDGSDVFPECIKKITCYNPEFLNRIRCKLMGRIIELNINPEEYLLLSAIILCNPAAVNLSVKGRTLISSYQKVYGSLLFQYCCQVNKKNGPLRFSELLTIFHAISQTHHDIGQFFLLFQMYQPNAQPIQLYQEVIDYMM